MSLFDFLKRKKEVQKAKEAFEKTQDKKQPEKKTEKILVKKETPSTERSVATEQIKKGKKIANFSYNIVKEPHISEKATYLAESNKYVFKVYDNANKPEIKKSVEGIYGVDVLSVNIVKIPNKKRRLGKTQGFKRGHIKAIVTIREGQKIEIL